jgi:phosphate-selective porin
VEQDAAAWRRILELRTEQVAQKSHDASNGSDLIRLHRRATSRFAASIPEQDLLHIWLSYAQAQAAYGQEKDARLPLRHIPNQKLGEQNAAFYLALATIEKEDHRSKPRPWRPVD